MTELLALTGPDNQPIALNPAAIVTVRSPRGNEHFAPGVKCLIHTADGKFLAVLEDCELVRTRLGG